MNAVQSEAERDSVPFTVIGFPCNQFLLQEPGNNKTELMNLAKYVRPGNGYVPNFPWYGPIDVNGADEHPLYTFMKDVCPPYQKLLGYQSTLFYDPLQSGDVTWNFEKYLVDNRGYVVARFNPLVTVREIYNQFVYPAYLQAQERRVLY